MSAGESRGKLGRMIDLGVVGMVFFEVFVPEDAEWPEPGTESRVSGLPVGVGGSLNGASVARALGLEVALASPRGNGITDRAIVSEVMRLGITNLSWPGPDDAAITLVRSTPHDRAFLTAVAEHALDGCPPLPPARWVHVGGLLEAERLAQRLAVARAAGARISVSAGWDEERLARLRAQLETHTGEPPWDLFFANTKELEALGAASIDALVGKLAHDVVISDGPRGAEARIGGVACAVDAHDVEVVDSTGAGDALAAAVISGLTRGLSGQEALELGARVAGRVVRVRGGVVEPELLADLVFSKREKAGTSEA